MAFLHDSLWRQESLDTIKYSNISWPFRIVWPLFIALFQIFLFADCCLSYSWEYSCRTSCDSWLSLFEKYLIWLTKNLKWNECLLMDVSRMEIDGRKPFQLFWRQEAARMSWLCELCIEGSLHTPPSTHGAEHHVNNAHTFYTFIYFHVVLAFCNVWLTWS